MIAESGGGVFVQTHVIVDLVIAWLVLLLG